MNFAVPRPARASRAIRHAIAGMALLAMSAGAQAPLDIRVALVIGNSAYAGTAALPNPVNDAKAMAESLRKLGFEVTEVQNGSREAMAKAIDAVRAQLRGKKGVGLFYYAGHGLQVDWRNYMVPVDAVPKTAADVEQQTVHVDAVIDAFKAAGNRMNIVVLDACRDNPFEGTATGKGLAQVDAPPGTFLAYATAPGNVAEDGKGSNGLYTGFLLQELPKPTARIEDVFKRVRLQVRQTSKGRQIPWESTSLEEDFVFNDGRAATAAPVAPPKATPAERDALFAAEKSEWDRIKASRNPDDFYAFLQKHPNGLISEAAQERLDRLAKPEVQATPVKGRERIQRDPRVGDELEFVYRDYLTKLETKRETIRVTAIKDDVIEFNDGAQVITMSGGTIRSDAGVVFDPPLQTVPVGDFQIGRKWVTRSTQTLPAAISSGRDSQGWVEQEIKITGYEPYKLPDGKTIGTYTMEAVLRTQGGLYGNIKYWVSGTGAIIRYERRARLGNGRDSSWIREVVRIHRPR